MSNRLAAWDLDGTLRPGSLLEDIIEYGAQQDVIDPSKFGNPRSPTYEEVGYFVEAITHQPKRIFQGLIDRLTEEARTQVFPWALERISAQHEDHHVVIFSHAPDFAVKAFARGLAEIRHARGSFLHTKNGVFSSRVKTLAKQEAATRYMREKGVTEFSFAAGDSLNDLPLLNRALHSVAVNPNEELAKIANEKGWEIVQA